MCVVFLNLMWPDEQEGLLCAGKGVRVIVLRLPPYVWGNGGSFFIPLHIQSARDKGKAFYILPGKLIAWYILLDTEQHPMILVSSTS